MNKAELIEKITDAMIDPWTDNPEDYLDAEPIDIEYAKVVLKDLRDNEDAAELEPDERLPEDVTPELVMLAYNNLILARKHEARVKRLAEYITDNEMVCEYSNYYLPTLKDGIDMIPVDFLTDTDGFPFIENASPIDILRIGMNSKQTFDPQHEFCWFDSSAMTIHSTDHPFGDGILNAEAFAEYAMSDEGQDCFDYLTNDIMDDDDFQSVFGCTREAYAKENSPCPEKKETLIGKTVIQLEFLKVKEGSTYLVTIPEDTTAQDIAYIIRAQLHNDGIVMTECYIDHEFRRED